MADTKFPLAREAILAFHSTLYPIIDQAWRTAESNEQVTRALAIEAIIQTGIAYAFWLDTKEVNSLKTVMETMSIQDVIDILQQEALEKIGGEV